MEVKKGQFAVTAKKSTIDRGHALLEKFEGATKEEKLVKLLDMVEDELTIRGLSPGLDSHLRSLLDSAENIKTSGLALVKAAGEHTKRETNALVESSAAKDRVLAEQQKKIEDLQANLDAALADAKKAQEEADKVHKALSHELDERETRLTELCKRIDEQSNYIELQNEKIAHQEDELRNAQNEIQRLMDELREP